MSMLFVALILFILLIFLAFKQGNNNLKRRKKVLLEQTKKQYTLSLTSSNYSIIDKMKLGLKYYSLELGDGGTVTSSFEYIKSDINKHIFMCEFEAVYSIFLLAAFNPFIKQSYPDKSLKIAEILANWGIKNEDVQAEQKRACEFVIFNDGLVDIIKLFSFIDKAKHNSIALLACDIAMYGSITEDYQEKFIYKISKVSESIKPIIAESMVYFENRKKASNIKWSFQNGEHIATT